MPRQAHTSPTMQRMGPGSPDKRTQALWCRDWEPGAETSTHKPCDEEDEPGEPRQVPTSPAMQRMGPGDSDKRTQALWCRGWARGTQTSAHKPRDTEAGPGEQSCAHKPVTQRLGTRRRDKWTQAPQCRGQMWGAETSALKPCYAEAETMKLTQVYTSPQHRGVSSEGWGKPTEVSTTQRAQSGSQEKVHTNPCPASFGQQSRAGQGNRSIAMIPETNWGLGTVEICWEGHFEAAVEIDVSNTARARRTAQTHTGPIETTGHCTALQRDEIQLRQPEHRHKLPQPGKHHRTLTRPHPQGRLHNQEEVRPWEPFFFSFFLINHPAYSPYIVSPSHYPFAVLWSFPLCFSC